MHIARILTDDPQRSVALLKRAFWAMGVVFLAAGLIGVVDRLAFGHRHANYGSIVTWGLWVAAYIYFIGLSAGSFLISSLVYVFDVKRFASVGRLALLTALITLLMALLSIVADIGHMFRAWHVVAYPNFRSPMAWMIWLYGLYFLLLVLEFWFVLRRDLVIGREAPGWHGRVFQFLTFGSRDVSEGSALRDKKVVKVLAIIGVPLAIMFHGGVGALFGVVAARPHWHSGMFPILFLLSALVSGGALVTMLAAIFQDGWTRNRQVVLDLGRLVLALLLLDVLFQVSEFLVAFRGGVPGHMAGLRLILTGPYWWVFWGWQGVIGTLIPVALLSLPTRRDPHWVSLAGFLIAAGLFGMRLNIVIPGLAVEEIRGLSEAVATVRTQPGYFPSLPEWLFTAAVTGMGLLLFGLGERMLPPHEDEVSHVPV